MWMPETFRSPKKFKAFSARLQPWLLIIFAILFTIGGVWGLLFTPADYLQGHLAKIMYVHVPAAWMSLFCYSLLAIFSGCWIIWRHPLSQILARSITPVGILMGIICLATGSIWGYPTWGTWWVWDARLTSMLVLVLLFIGYQLVIKSVDIPQQAVTAASWLAVIGFVNVPIVKYSVEWWHSLHQPASISSLEKLRDPAIDNALLWPLLIMAVAYSSYTAYCLLKNANYYIEHRSATRQAANV